MTEDQANLDDKMVTPSSEPSFDVIVNDDQLKSIPAKSVPASALTKPNNADGQLKSIVVGGLVLLSEPKSPFRASASRSPLQPRTLFKNNKPLLNQKEVNDLLAMDDEVVEISASNFTPRKRRHVKVQEQLEDSFLRRSKRLSDKSGGFKNAKSAKMAETVIEPVPLAMIPAPGTTPAPHLTKAVVQGIVEASFRFTLV